MKIEGDFVTFSTGRKKHANYGIIGIGPDDDEISGGFDGTIYRSDWIPDKEDIGEDGEDHGCHLTPAEQIELADYMMKRWEAFGKTARGCKETT